MNFPVLKNDLFLRALRREKTPYTPMWLMRQAGRYLPEYRQTRAQAGDFLTLCKNPELACEVTLQPIDRYGFDAAILFSDILTIPDAMGLGLRFSTGEGPVFDHPLRDEKNIFALNAPNPHEHLDYVLKGVTTIRHALNGRVPLIGFSGSPWTLACYMIEGCGSKDEFFHTRKMLYTRPDLVAHILQINVQAIIQYLNAQIEAGAQAVMIFDTWGSLLAEGYYQTYSLDPIAQILKGLHREYNGEYIPRIVFTKGGGVWLDDIANTECDAIGLDWTVNLSKARQQVGKTHALQGNLDPMCLLGTPAEIQKAVRKVLNEFGDYPGHIFNLGHGISQHTPTDNVSILVEAVRQFKID